MNKLLSPPRHQFVTITLIDGTSINVGSDRYLQYGGSGIPLEGILLEELGLIVIVATDGNLFKLRTQAYDRTCCTLVLSTESRIGTPTKLRDFLTRKFFGTFENGSIVANQPEDVPRLFKLSKADFDGRNTTLLGALGKLVDSIHEGTCPEASSDRMIAELCLSLLRDQRLDGFISSVESLPGFRSWDALLGYTDPWLDAQQRYLKPMAVSSRSQAAEQDFLANADSDFLAAASADGFPVSVGQVIARVARRKVKPCHKCCIVATARNEGLYIVDWIAHHRAIGVEKFFIYTNNNTDNSDPLLRALDKAGEIIWIRNVVGQFQSPQYKAYGHAFGIMPDVLAYEWSAVIDIDEFIVIDTTAFLSLQDFLDSEPVQKADAVALGWIVFGSHGQTTWSPEPVVERFITCGSQDITHVKSIFRPHKVSHSQCHFPWSDGLSNLNFVDVRGEPHRGVGTTELALARMHLVENQGAWINHYWFKSAQEFIDRRRNNTGDQTVQTNSVLPESLAEMFNTEAESVTTVDTRALYHARHARKIAMQIRLQPGVLLAESAIESRARRSTAGETLPSEGPQAQSLNQRVRQGKMRNLTANNPTEISRTSLVKHAFSWEGEDLLVYKIAQDYLGITIGFYLDVGAHHPHAMSNTQFLYDRGWRGMNIDATPGSMAAFHLMRPEDINLELGVAQTESQLLFSMFSNPMLNGFLPPEVVALQVQNGAKLIEQRVIAVAPLSSILRLHGIHSVDFLSIDVEGLDEEVVKSLDLAACRPKLILMEVLGARDIADIQSNSATKLMNELGYTLFSRLHFSVLYMDKALVR